jgi:HK97 family phage portal protein
MRLPFGFVLARQKSLQAAGLNAINSTGNGGWMSLIRESFPGAFQSVTTLNGTRDLLAYSAVFACVTRIAADIGKLDVMLMQKDDNDISEKVRTNSPFLPVLRKPNRHQIWIKFMEQWIVSKLLYGNTYIFKVRDARGMVTAMYVLDPTRTTPLVSDSGDVYYQISSDNLVGIADTLTVPASEIIHDTMVALFHPLVGVSPIYACAASATLGTKIQNNSVRFFGNMSRPSGMLTAPGQISPETAERLKAHWEENFSGDNVGRTAVLGDGLKYEGMIIPATDAQLIEQLKWTIEDVARCFNMPLFKIGGPVPPTTTIEALNMVYYTDCLQALIESAEDALTEGLSLPSRYEIEFDLDGLLRMDTAARYKAKNDAVSGGWMSPNEARAGENYKPVPGGDSPMIQQQNFSLAALAKRDASADPFGTAAPKAAAIAPPAVEQPQPAKEATKLVKALITRLQTADVCA